MSRRSTDRRRRGRASGVGFVLTLQRKLVAGLPQKEQDDEHDIAARELSRSVSCGPRKFETQN